MEGLSATVYTGLRGYWKRKGYERLDGLGRRRKKRVVLARMDDSNGSGRRRFWRFKMKPKLRFWRRMGSPPKKFFVKLRDAYVKMMLGFANSRVVSTGYGAAAGQISGFSRTSLNEYDERMIFKIYKSLVLAQTQLVPRDAARLATEIR